MSALTDSISTREARAGHVRGASDLGPSLLSGPTWNSFEQFRVKGGGALEEIPRRGVATLRSKAGAFRILHDEDFQAILGLASEVHRLKGGVKLIISAAQIYSRFRDDAHRELLLEAVSLLAGSPVLPERVGHAEFAITPEEEAEAAADDFDLNTTQIPRPVLGTPSNAK